MALNWQVPLCRPEFRDEELTALVDAYRSGWLIVGPRTAELEQAFCDYTGARYAVAVSSCSAALHLACRAAGLGPGDSVIAPSLTFTSTINAVTHVGAAPRFAEIAGLTEPWLSAEAAEEAIDDRTKAILTMAYGGHLGETAELAQLAKDRGLILIEDAAHAAGSRLNGRHAGTFGLAGAFSFSASKNLGIGEGGMLVTDEDAIVDRVARQRWHGLASEAWHRHHEKAPQYELGELGFNYRFDDPRSALVLARLGHLDEDNRRRAAIDAAFRDAFSDLELLKPTAAPDPDQPSSYCMFTAVLDKSVDRERFRANLATRGIQTSIHYPPVHLSGNYAHADIRLPATEAYGRRSVTLPMFPQMTSSQQDLVTSAVRESLADPVRATTTA